METMIERNKRNVLRFLEDTHSGKFDIIEEVVSPDIVTHGFPGANPSNRDEYKQFFSVLDATFRDMGLTVEALVAEDDKVAVRFTVSGVHVGEYLGIKPTGRAVSFTGMVIYRLKDGRIAETWLHPDNLTLLQQLGAIGERPAA